MNSPLNTYFWNHEYRHYMRDLKPSLQNEVKKTFIEWELELTGVSDLHEQIICEIIGDYTIIGEGENERTERLEHSYKNDECANCCSTLGIDCGDAEQDYNDEFCSEGCFNEYMEKFQNTINELKTKN